MRKLTKLPREEAANNDDGLPVDGDVEGHGVSSDRFAPRLPGTGGDALASRRPSSGGELTDDDDVEGHSSAVLPGLPGTGGDSLLPSLPGTGGDSVRRPIGGGEARVDDDSEDRRPG
jgi:hypothetical protein